MRILFLTQILPYPPDAGPRVKTWNVLRYLAQKGHEVHLASFVRSEEVPYLDDLRRLCSSVTAIPIQRSRPTDLFAWVRSHFTGRPFLVERDDVRAMRERVIKLVDAEKIEAVHADQLSMAQFAIGVLELAKNPPLLVFDAHNAVWKVVERMKGQMPALMWPALELESRRTKSYEGQVVRTFDRTLVVSDADREAFLEASLEQPNGDGEPWAANRITVVPIGVDTEGHGPTETNSDSLNILALGTLHYPPNADGVRWFAQDIFPRIQAAQPHATLTLAGKNPPDDILQLGNSPAIEVTGYVRDISPLIESAALMVVPVRAGGGMRVRILEGFARGIPMVTTTVGLEGIQAEPGRDILIADTPEDFSEATIALLRNPDLRVRMVQNGRRLVAEKYDWRSALRPLDEIYAPVEAHAI